MSKQGIKQSFSVEWINVTYRSVGATVVTLILLLGGGGYFWHYKARVKPHNEAREAIAQATSRLSEASNLPMDDSTTELFGNAKVNLGVARSAFSDAEFEEATIYAMRSDKLSTQIIRLAGGDDSQARNVRFNRIEGDVRVKQAGGFSWTAAHKNMSLQIGDQVKTSSSASAEVIYFDGTMTRIQPGSLLEIRDLYEDPVTKVRRVKEKLSFGEIQASTRKRNVNGSYHEVAAGKVAARADDAGKFRVALDPDTQDSVVDVFQGRVELTAGGRKATLDEGERVRADAAGNLSDKESLPGVPRLVSPSDQRVFLFEDPSSQQFTLSWEALPGFRRYRLMISDKPLFTRPRYDAEREGSSAVIAGIDAGSYYWKVAAIADDGAEGPFSPPRRFRVSSQQIRDRTDTEPPKLEITEFVTIGQMVIINGETEPGATLWIDNNKIDVYEDGSFNAVVRLRREGLNNLLVVAQDTAGNESKVKRAAFVEGY